MEPSPDNFFEFTVDAEQRGKRLDHVLSELLESFSRSQINKLNEQNHILVDNKSVKSGYRLRLNNKIQVEIPPPTLSAKPQDIPLDVVYEDSHLIVINKPAGMVVHPGAGHPDGTLVNALMYHCKDLSGIGGELRPGIVHRLDKETSGLIVSAKNDHAHRALSEQFAAKTAGRTYWAIVYNAKEKLKGTIDKPLIREPNNRIRFTTRLNKGKSAVTHWKSLENFPPYSWFEVQLETGRTHQIRVHLTESGLPLLGDSVYNAGLPQIPKALKQLCTRQALHAHALKFMHPDTGQEIEFKCKMPEDMEIILQYLRDAG